MGRFDKVLSSSGGGGEQSGARWRLQPVLSRVMFSLTTGMCCAAVLDAKAAYMYASTILKGRSDVKNRLFLSNVFTSFLILSQEIIS